MTLSRTPRGVHCSYGSSTSHLARGTCVWLPHYLSTVVAEALLAVRYPLSTPRARDYAPVIGKGEPEFRRARLCSCSLWKFRGTAGGSARAMGTASIRGILKIQSLNRTSSSRPRISDYAHRYTFLNHSRP